MDRIQNIEIMKNEDLSNHTSFRVGGNVDYLVYPLGVKALIETINHLKTEDIPYFIIGNGTNVLVTDKGFRGVCIKLTQMNGINIEDNVAECECGALLSKVSNKCLENGLSGFEQLGGIPGTVGGSIFMNAGAYGREIADILISSTYIDFEGNIKTISKDEHNFSYRHSFYSENTDCIIISAKFQLKEDLKENIKQTIQDCKTKRIDKQPLEYPSGGSTFKRPDGHFAGKLIEDAGLKGYTVGGAMVSEKHAGFIINHNHATCIDILTLIEVIKNRVFEKNGVDLECEIRIIGE